MILDKNYDTNLKNFPICFLARFRKLSNVTQDLDPNLQQVNSFFAHWIKEIDITKYGTDKSLIQTTTPLEVCKYSDAMLKHLPKNVRKMIQKYILFSKKVIIYLASSDRRSCSNDDAIKRTDDNIEDKEDKFAMQIGSKSVYRIPLKYFCDLGKINFPTKIDIKICCTLETEMKKLFESKKKVMAIGAPDAQIVFLKAPFIQYEHILLTKSFRQYLETIMLSSKVLRMGIQKNTIEKPTSFRRDCQNSR